MTRFLFMQGKEDEEGAEDLKEHIDSGAPGFLILNF